MGINSHVLNITEKIMNPDSSWHLDKRIPISIVVVLILQIVSFSWMAAKQQFTIDLLMQRMDRVELQQMSDRKSISDNRETVLLASERLSVLREQNVKILVELDEIKKMIVEHDK